MTKEDKVRLRKERAFRRKANKEKYFNLATLIATGFMTYLVFWFMFNIMIK